MKKTIIKVSVNTLSKSHYYVTFDSDAKRNPFRIMYAYYDYDKNNALRKRVRQAACYGDLHSCMHYLIDVIPNTEDLENFYR